MQVNTDNKHKDLSGFYKTVQDVKDFDNSHGHLFKGKPLSSYTRYILNNVIKSIDKVDSDNKIVRIDLKHSWQILEDSESDEDTVIEVCDAYVQTLYTDMSFRIIPPHSIQKPIPFEDIIKAFYSDLNLDRDFQYMQMEINGEDEYPIHSMQKHVLLALVSDAGNIDKGDYIMLCVELFKLLERYNIDKRECFVTIENMSYIRHDRYNLEDKASMFFICDSISRSVMSEKSGNRFLINVAHGFKTPYFSMKMSTMKRI